MRAHPLIVTRLDMVSNPALRVALGTGGVSIWSAEIFGGSEPSRLREFLSRAFSVQEVDGIELQRASSFGRVRYGSALDPAQIWRKLSRALGAPEDGSRGVWPERPPRVDARLLYLDGPGSAPVRVSRIGNVLSTWRVRGQSESRLSLWHPILRNRRDVVFRLEEELASILGVQDFRASAITARVSIRFDARVIDVERLARELEKAWPRLLEGLDGPPSQKRLFAAFGLAGLAYAGQYVVPALRPVAVAGATLYAFPNVVNGVKDLTHGKIGLSALYSTGLAFMLFSGMPFTAGVMAALMQFWPHLTHRKLVHTQRRLFATERRASPIGALLPRAPFPGLPSALEAERVADRNAKPALLLSALNLLVRRSLPPSQGAIRPDYATAPRLSAQLSALQGVARAWHQGVLVRNPAALDHLGRADVYVLDDGAGLARRCLEVASIQTIDAVSTALVAACARAAHPRGEQGLALAAIASNGKAAVNGATVHPKPDSFQRLAGVTRYRDGSGRAIEVASSRYIAASDVAVPERWRALLPRPFETENGHSATEASEPNSSPPPLWVLRDGALIGVVSFARTGELFGRQVVAALRAQGKKKRIVYVSRGADAEAQALARTLGIPTALGGLSPTGKVDFVRGLGKTTLWVGDSSDPDARSLIAASTISISVAPWSHSRDEAADILLLRAGLHALPAVFDIARGHARRLARDYRTLYATNLLGVAGAFLANFSPLQVGLLSNLGTGLVYTRQAWVLEQLARAAEKQQARFEPALPA